MFGHSFLGTKTTAGLHQLLMANAINQVAGIELRKADREWENGEKKLSLTPTDNLIA